MAPWFTQRTRGTSRPDPYTSGDPFDLSLSVPLLRERFGWKKSEGGLEGGDVVDVCWFLWFGWVGLGWLVFWFGWVGLVGLVWFCWVGLVGFLVWLGWLFFWFGLVGLVGLLVVFLVWFGWVGWFVGRFVGWFGCLVWLVGWLASLSGLSFRCDGLDQLRIHEIPRNISSKAFLKSEGQQKLQHNQ